MMDTIAPSSLAGGRVKIGVRRLEHGANLPLPQHATPSSAGVDLQAAVAQDLTLAPSHRALVPTGIAIELPAGFEAQVRPRSGLANKHGVTVLNAPGTIDADYRGEVCVLLINHGTVPFIIKRGMRIAQMVVAPVSFVNWHESQDLNPSERGTGGFGSTGTTSLADTGQHIE